MTIPDASAAGTFDIGGDLRVNRIAYGAMRITGAQAWGPPPDKEAMARLLRRAVELGINLIDTADAYGPHVSEALIAEALHPYPEGLVIATKGGFERPEASRWTRNGRPEHLRRACEGSLRRLKRECIDLYQFHTPDPDVPYEESIGALADLRREGKIRHAGVSNVSVDELERARRIVPVASVQNRYNLADLKHEPVLDYCERHGIAFLPWYPLATGELAQRGGPLAGVADRHGATTGQVALAWLLQHSRVTLPIPGTSKREHLEENVAAAAVRLSESELRSLDQVGDRKGAVARVRRERIRQITRPVRRMVRRIL